MAFREMHNLYQKLKARHHTVDTLSMGMTGDFELAIEEGSTMIRVGTARSAHGNKLNHRK